MNHYGVKFIYSSALFVIFSACRPEPIHETVWIPALPPESDGIFSLQAEELGVINGHLDSSHGVMAYQDNDEIVVLSPWYFSESRFLGRLQGVLSVQNKPLLFTDEGVLWFQDNEFAMSPLSSIWSSNYRDGYSDPYGFWLLGDDDVYRYSGSTLTRINVGGDFAGAIGFGATYEDYPALWLSMSDGLHQLVDLPSGAAISHSVGLNADVVCVDSHQDLWALDQDGRLFRRERISTEWAHVPLPEPAINLMCNPASEVVWIHMSTQDWLYDGASFLLGDSQCLSWHSVDHAGRLICTAEGRLNRLSLSRPLGFTGLPIDRIYRSFELALDPSFAEEVESIHLRLNGYQVPMEGPPWKTVIQPSEWGQGLLTIGVDVQYQNGEVYTHEREREIDLGIPTWDDDIEPLYEVHCSMCHGGSTYTLLDEKDLWIDGIDMIMTQVQSGDMPQGAPPLDIDQISTLQLWIAGGFQ